MLANKSWNLGVPEIAQKMWKRSKETEVQILRSFYYLEALRTSLTSLCCHQRAKNAFGTIYDIVTPRATILWKCIGINALCFDCCRAGGGFPHGTNAAAKNS